jgi:hypothetical protein
MKNIFERMIKKKIKNIEFAKLCLNVKPPLKKGHLGI